jgi:hypothetical protein
MVNFFAREVGAAVAQGLLDEVEAAGELFLDGFFLLVRGGRG